MRMDLFFPLAALVLFIHATTADLAPLEDQDTSPQPQDVKISKPPMVVQIPSNMGRPGALLYSLDQEYTLRTYYTLKCVSYDTVYTVIASTSAQDVARITSDFVFNVSCADARPMVMTGNMTAAPSAVTSSDKDDLTTINPSSSGQSIALVGVVTGGFNMTIKTSTIGRSFLFLIANKVSGPDIDISSLSAQMTPPSGAGSQAGASYNTSGVAGNSDNVHVNRSDRAPPMVQGPPPGMVIPGLPPNTVGVAMVIVLQLPRTVDEVFRIVLYVVIIFATAGMGVKVDLSVIKKVLKKPVAPVIGLLCQYLCMPLVAYMVAKLVPQESAAVSLGIFACGIVPGGGASNMFSYLLGGDLSLSVTMTTISNIAALGLLPLYIFTLGDTFKDDTVKLKIPYEKILETLAVVLLPLLVGIFIQYKLPRVAKIFVKILKPALIVIVAFVISFGIYTNLFIFKMIQPMSILAGCLLPYVGYLIGGLVAFVCCQPWPRVKTIAIETGIQNTGIAFLILFLSLPPPDNQLSVVGPASSAIMTPLPLFVAVILYSIYNRCINKNKADSNQEKPISPEKVADSSNNEKKVMSKRAHGEGTAAIVLLWRKITGTKEEVTLEEKMLNYECVISAPEKEKLVFDPDRESFV